VSVQRFSGKLGGRQGTFVLQGSQELENGKPDEHTREGAAHPKEQDQPERGGKKRNREIRRGHENVKAKNVYEHRAHPNGTYR
jgi:hypothetical protein